MEVICRCSFASRAPQSLTSVAFKVLRTQRRWKNGPNHWATLRNKTTSKERALKHFDDFYASVFSSRWNSVRLGLLTKKKYCALVNNYSDTARIISALEDLGAINLESLLEAHRKRIVEAQTRVRREKELNNVFILDKKLERINKQKVQEELEELYPSETPDHLPSPENISSSVSTRSALSDRLIEDSSSLSLHEFVPATKLIGREDWVPESEHYAYYPAGSELKVRVEKQPALDFPSQLKLYTFEMGNISDFPRARRGITGVTDYFLMDGGSVLPVLALGLEPGDRVLDMCAAPGGKSLLCLQTLLPETVVCNDSSISRSNRIKRMLDEFFYDSNKKQDNGEIQLTQTDARSIDGGFKFNKILVDVPCTNDRHSVSEDDNNIFRPDRIKERIRLPEVQAQILTNALKIVEPGGVVVYSTCSLSPIQNDGVVQMALKSIWEETNHEISVVNMRKALQPARIIFRFAEDIGMKYGHLVVPYLPSNFGPIYFCKFIKRK